LSSFVFEDGKFLATEECNKRSLKGLKVHSTLTWVVEQWSMRMS